MIPEGNQWINAATQSAPTGKNFRLDVKALPTTAFASDIGVGKFETLI